eukprot:1158396-Pelagomonas_calceolata.AAC.14
MGYGFFVGREIKFWGHVLLWDGGGGGDLGADAVYGWGDGNERWDFGDVRRDLGDTCCCGMVNIIFWGRKMDVGGTCCCGIGDGIYGDERCNLWSACWCGMGR